MRSDNSINMGTPRITFQKAAPEGVFDTMDSSFGNVVYDIIRQSSDVDG